MFSLFQQVAVTRKRLPSRTVLLVVAIALLFGSVWAAWKPVPAYAQQGSRLFPATGYTVSGAFLKTFDQYGGVRIFGYPITAEIVENGLTVQYFERQRFEYHPEYKGTPYEVLLGALGVESAQGRASLAPVGAVPITVDRLYFKETGHTLSGAFLSFWRANGDIRIMGYPITEPTNINGLLTQYFERARMEYHPEKAAAGYAVELGHLGREYVAARPGIQIGAPVQPTSAPPPGIDASAMGKSLLQLINNGRQAKGLKAVTIDGKVQTIAQGRSDDMAARGYFSHVTPEGKGYEDFLKASSIRYKWSGEIINMNNFREELAAQKAYEFFVNSPTHHAIMLEPRFNYAGIGVTKNSKGFYIFTVVFIQSY